MLYDTNQGTYTKEELHSNFIDNGNEKALFSPWSLIHALMGYYAAKKIKFSTWMVMHTVFELWESSKTGVEFAREGDSRLEGILDYLGIEMELPLYEGDTTVNSFGDTIAATVGYLLYMKGK